MLGLKRSVHAPVYIAQTFSHQVDGAVVEVGIRLPDVGAMALMKEVALMVSKAVGSFRPAFVDYLYAQLLAAVLRLTQRPVSVPLL